MIEQVLKIINDQLKGIDAAEIIYGIGQTITRISGSVKDTLPGIVNRDGEIAYVGIDDTYSLIIYHKLNSTAITLNKNGTGNRYGDITNNNSLSLYAYWDFNKINIRHDELLMLLQSRIPIAISGLENIKIAIINQTNAILNSNQIYAQEYSYDDQKLLPENKNILQLNYNIQITFNPDCFRQCPQCNPQ